MQVAICDDDATFRNQIIGFLIQYKKLHLLCIDIFQFKSGNELLSSNDILYLYIILYDFTSIISLYLSNMFLNTILTDLIVSIIVLSIHILLCLSKVKFILRQLYEYTPRNCKFIILILITTETLLMELVIDYNIYENTYIWFNITQKFISTVVIFTFISSIIMVSIGVTNTHLKILKKNYEHQIQVQAKYYNDLAAATQDLRRFKHDFKNMSIAMLKFIDDGDNEGALSVLKNYEDMFYSTEINVSKFKTGNGIADALLSDKQKTANSVNTSIEFTGMIPPEQLSPIDICVLLGNTLDNAIEACQKLKYTDKKIITIESNFVGSMIFFKITNPVKNKVFIRNNHVESTKEDSTLHGFGLYSLKNIVKKYSGSLKISSTDNLFTIEAVLHLNQNLKNIA